MSTRVSEHPPSPARSGADDRYRSLSPPAVSFSIPKNRGVTGQSGVCVVRSLVVADGPKHGPLAVISAVRRALSRGVFGVPSPIRRQGNPLRPAGIVEGAEEHIVGQVRRHGWLVGRVLVKQLLAVVGVCARTGAEYVPSVLLERHTGTHGLEQRRPSWPKGSGGTGWSWHLVSRCYRLGSRCWCRTLALGRTHQGCRCKLP
jgi:hypothetical protein